MSRRVRLVVYIAASALTGLAVAMSGSIGYVGLLVPHVMRMIFGSDHRLLIPASAFGGAIVLVIADTLARTIAAPVRTSGRSDHRDRGCAAVYLFAAKEIGVTVATTVSAIVARSAMDASRAASEPRLSVEQVSYAYAPNPQQAPIFTLEATSFQAKSGEVVAILGPNASGKSTLLQIVSGALQPLSGRVLLERFCDARFGTADSWPANRDGAAGKPTVVSVEGVGICDAGPASLWANRCVLKPATT